MVFPILASFVLCKLIFSGIHVVKAEAPSFISADHLNMSASPEEVIPGLTQELAISCSLPSRTADYRSVMSVILKKWNRTVDAYTELAVVNIFHPDHGGLMEKDLSDKIKGRIEPTGQSFLELDWSHPDEQDLGTFSCEANVLDSTGHPLTIVANLELSPVEVDILTVLKQVRQLRENQKGYIEEIESLKEAVKSRKDNYSKIQMTIENITASVDAAKSSISDLSDKFSNRSCDCSLEPPESPKSKLINVKFCNGRGNCSEAQIEVNVTEGDNPSNRCYKLSSQTKDWFDANKTCIAKGGRLAEVHDMATMELLQNGDVFFHSAFVGARDLDYSEQYVWESGSKVTLDNWGYDEPNESRGSENCLAIDYNGYLMDWDCYWEDFMFYLCEKEDTLDCLGWQV